MILQFSSFLFYFFFLFWLQIKAILVGSERETQKLQDEVYKVKDHCSKELSTVSIKLQNTETELKEYQYSAEETRKKVLETFTYL